MITDIEIKQRGIKALIADLGNVQAERFITLIIREPFDYTKWQRDLWPMANQALEMDWAKPCRF
jgi:hypothetical protein